MPLACAARAILAVGGTLLVFLLVTVAAVSAQGRVLPDPVLTPGVTNLNITPANIAQTICNPHWSTQSIRPPHTYTEGLKQKQLKPYGYTDLVLSHYEEDHLIPLELGGHPTDPQNLWPELWTGTLGAKTKDKVEDYLHRLVCTGQLDLREAQHLLATNWTRCVGAMQSHQVCH